MTPDPQRRFAPGSIIAGKFRVERVLGEGGMGVVLAATQLDLVRPVAVKMPHRELLSDGDARGRFLREARAAAALENDHAVRVLDIGSTEDGTPYIAMERLEGGDLEKVLRGLGTLELRVAVECLLEACRAIGEAHARGIVHRDIKPSNLFVARRFDGSERIVVLDFGLSKSLPTAGSHLELTGSADAMGSPMYMSPERVRASEQVDARSDIWALGAVLYELVTGKPAFSAPSLTALAAKIVTDPPVPPRTLMANIPAELEAVILRCLEKEPADRFASVNELTRALRPFALPVGEKLSLLQRLRPHADDEEAPPLSTAETIPALVSSTGAAPPLRDAGESHPRPAPATPVSPTRRWRLIMVAAGLAALGATVVALTRRGSTPTDASKAVIVGASPEIACSVIQRRTYRAAFNVEHSSLAAGLSDALVGAWGTPVRLDDNFAPHTIEGGLLFVTKELPDVRFAPSLPLPLTNSGIFPYATTLQDDLVAVTGVKVPHGRNPKLTTSMFVLHGLDEKRAWNRLMGAQRPLDHLSNKFAVASSPSALEVVSVGTRVIDTTAQLNVKPKPPTVHEVVVLPLFGPHRVRRIFESTSDDWKEWPQRPFATSGSTRNVAAFTTESGALYVLPLDTPPVPTPGDSGAAPTLTQLASNVAFVVPAGRGEEVIIAWKAKVDGKDAGAPGPSVVYRRLGAGRDTFDDAVELPFGPSVFSFTITSEGGTYFVAWTTSEGGRLRTRYGMTRGRLEDALQHPIELDIGGDVIASAMKGGVVWLMYGSASARSLVSLECPRLPNSK